MTILVPRRRRTGGTALPRPKICLSIAIRILMSAFVTNLPRRVLKVAATAELIHEFLVLVVRRISSNSSTWRSGIAPVLATSAVRAVASHMSSITTHATDDVGGEIALLWTVVLAVADLAAVLACLILIVSKGAVQGSEFAELIALKFVLAFWDGGSLRSVRKLS